MTELETLIHDALVEDATAAPELDEHWNSVRLTTTTTVRRGRSAPRYAVAAVLAAACIAGLFVLADRRGASTPADAPDQSAPGWSPPGTEFPTRDLGVPASSPHLGVASLLRAIGIEGHPPLIVSTTLSYDGGATATLQRCTSENGSAGCTMEWDPATNGSISQTSSIDNGVADHDLWIWDEVPDGTAYVTYGPPDNLQWQRPIAGVVAFPVTTMLEQGVAYSGDGTVLGRSDDVLDRRDDAPVVIPPRADISATQYRQLYELTDATLRDCLVDAGATIIDNVAAVADDLAVWSNCVSTTKNTIAGAVADLGATFYDPATQRPTDPDPAQVYGD